MSAGLPTVTVAIASRREDGDLTACLAAFETQRDDGTEIVVATAGTAFPSTEFPWACWVDGPADALVPRLWGLALSRARGDVVAFTTTQFRPRPEWLGVIRASHARLGAAGIGGPIDPPPTGRAFDWAVYFLRYSAYLAYDREVEIADLAGDNASYKRAALRSVGADTAGEFWEQEAHRALRGGGEALVFVPGMRVQQVGSPPAGAFLGDRMRHGRRFGADRARRHATPWRLAALCAAPLIPLVVLAKVVARVLRARRPWSRLAGALPALAACCVAWGLGEASGYWSAIGDRDAARR